MTRFGSSVMVLWFGKRISHFRENLLGLSMDFPENSGKEVRIIVECLERYMWRRNNYFLWLRKYLGLNFQCNNRWEVCWHQDLSAVFTLTEENMGMGQCSSLRHRIWGHWGHVPQDFVINKGVPSFFLENVPFSWGKKCPQSVVPLKFEMLPTPHVGKPVVVVLTSREQGRG